MKSKILLATLLGCACAVAFAQSPPAALPVGNSLQSWQDPGLPAVLAKCKNPAKPFSLPPMPPASAAPPPAPASKPVISTAIPGVIAAGQTWKVVWAGDGNNADGIIATPDGGGILAARNDASDVMKVDANGAASIVHRDTHTGGSLSRNSKGALFIVARGLNPAVWQLEPQRKLLANSYQGEPLDCLGGILNDLVADSKGGAYLTFGGVFYASPSGVITQYGQGLQTNGITLSRDEKTLYVTNAQTLVAFDVQPDGALSNQREFAKLAGGRGDGSAIDAAGRIYVSTGSGVDVVAPDGKFLGTIPGPEGLHGVAFSGTDKKTLYAVTLTGFMTPIRKSQVISIPMIAQGYQGRAK
jgi:gluconolactonase